MSEYLQKIIYLTRAQYDTLSGGGTVGSQTGLNSNYLYCTTDENITTADLGDLIVPVSKGGTGKTSFTVGSLLVGNSNNALTEIAATNSNTANTVVKRDSSGNFSAGTITAALSGNATTCTYPLGFSSRTASASWGNTTGTSFTSWNDSTGGSIDFRRDNPSSGKMSLKVDGRFYFNEGNTPAAGLKSANSYWGMTGPDGEDNVWIRTTSQGIIPYQSGSASAGHCQLGTDSWYFSKAYVQNIYGTLNGNASTATNFAAAKNIALTGDITGNADGGASGGWSIATTIKSSVALTGTPTAPTAANGTNTTQIATTAFVNNTLTYAKAMTFKGTLGTNGTVTALPASHNAGDTYRVITAGTWAGKTCVAGDLIICVNTGTTATDTDWTSVETNEDGAVIGPAEADSTTDNAIVRWDSTTGRVIQNSGVTIDDNNNISNVNQLNISNTTAAIHLGFARTGGHNSPNYINVPASSSLAISVGGASGTNIIAMIDPEGIVPFTTNTKSIGTSTYKWNAVYATTYYGALETKTTGTSAARPVWFSYYASSAVQDGVLEKDTDFTYNPSTNVLVVGKLTITGGTTNSTIASSGTLDIANATKALTVSTTTAALTISTSNGALEAKSTGTGTVKLTSNSGAMTLSTTSGNMSLSSGGTVSISSGSNKALSITSGSTMSLGSGTSMSISSGTEQTTTISSGSTMYLNKPTNASIIFTSGGASTTYEKARFNTNGNLQIDPSNAAGTQNTHKLYVKGDSAFEGKIAFATAASNAITNKAYMQWNATDLSIDFIFV